MDGELGGIERLALAQVLAGRHGFVPRLEGHKDSLDS
jgi:hypothetical protein